MRASDAAVVRVQNVAAKEAVACTISRCGLFACLADARLLVTRARCCKSPLGLGLGVALVWKSGRFLAPLKSLKARS